MKKTDDKKQAIVETVRTLNPTKVALCKKFGITWQTLKNWLEEDAAFKCSYEKAISDYLNEINIEVP